MNTADLEKVLNGFAGRGSEFTIHATTDGGYAIVAKINRRELEMSESSSEMRGVVNNIMDSVIALAAAAYFADHKSEIFAAMSPEAIANLAVADAARHLRESVIDPKKG